MKKTMFLATVMAGLAAPLLADTTNVAAPTMAPAIVPTVSVPTNGVLGDENARFSYAIGLRMGGNWKQAGFEVDDTMLLRGLKDSQSGVIPLLSTQESTEVLNQFQKKMQAKQMAQRAELAAKNKAEGEAFLATNKNNAGVITLPSGLQYKVVTAGDGPLPAATNSVKVNYRGTLIDGTEFDSSAKAGHPLSISVTGGVIKGWTEALQLMKVGSKWQLYVPSSLAYGERGNRGIAPNSVLIFDIELLEILPPKAPAAAPAPVAPSAPLTSDIIKVPSAEELKKGAKIEYIKPEDVQKAQAEAAQTNPVSK